MAHVAAGVVEDVADLPGRALDALSGAAHGLSRIAESVANIAEGVVDAFAGLFGGGSSSAPTPQQGQERPAPTPAPAPKQEPPVMAKQPPARVQASGDGGEVARRETEERKARVQEIAHRLGVGDSPLTKEQIEALEMEHQRRSRDGGISR